MAADWLKPRALPDDLDHVRDLHGVALVLRVVVLVFVWSFAAGTAVPEWEAGSFAVGAGAALVGAVFYVRAMRGLGPERNSRPVNDWLLYRPEPGAGALRLGLFGLLGVGLATIIVAAVVRVVVG